MVEGPNTTLAGHRPQDPYAVPLETEHLRAARSGGGGQEESGDRCCPVVAAGSPSRSGWGRSPPGFEESSFLDPRTVTLCCSKSLLQKVDGPLALVCLLVGSRAWWAYSTRCLNNGVRKGFPGSPGEKGNEIRHSVLTIRRRKALGAWRQPFPGARFQAGFQRSLLRRVLLPRAFRQPCASGRDAVRVTARTLSASPRSTASRSQLWAPPPPPCDRVGGPSSPGLPFLPGAALTS